jgi:hypothetical protein
MEIEYRDIQQPYDTGFPTIWEYAEAVRRREVDFSAVEQGKCPICGARGCLRRIPSYERTVTELFPEVRTGKVPVVRFLCRKTGRTVSLLPLELAPFHRYTVPTMLWVLVLLHGLFGRESLSVEDAVLGVVADDNDLTAGVVRRWSDVAVRGLRRGHAELRKEHDLSGIRSGTGLRGRVGEVVAYLDACGVRGPPASAAEVVPLLRSYSRGTGRFLIGRPTQERR